jgi:hypothetical protein
MLKRRHRLAAAEREMVAARGVRWRVAGVATIAVCCDGDAADQDVLDASLVWEA